MSNEYLMWSIHILTLNEHQCHPALFATREKISRELVAASKNPDNAQNQALLAGVKFLCYSLPGK